MNNVIETLLINDQFVQKVASMSPEEAQKEFATEGVDISIKELNEIAASVNSYIKKDGELDETDLDNVAGGLSLRTLAGIVRAISLIPMPVPRFAW